VDLGGLAPIQVFLGHDYWRLFTSMFLHGGLIHLAFNMWALWAIGGFIEAAVGRLKFVIIYFVSGLAGSVMVLLAAPANVTVVVSWWMREQSSRKILITRKANRKNTSLCRER